MATELSSASPAIAELCHVTKTFPQDHHPDLKVLEDINLVVRENEYVALLGQSGSGKSTLLRCLCGLTSVSSGEVHERGRVLNGVNPEMSVVFQSFALYPWLTVEQNIAVGLMAQKMSQSERRAAVHRVIEHVGLTSQHSAYPRELSGGMRQRVGLARALVSEPTVLCLDEAFSSLDVLTTENLRQETLALWQNQTSRLKSVFMVTHQIEEAVEMATRICVLFPHPGRIGLSLENPMPYPRDVQSIAFQKLVSHIHEAITTCTLPDSPPEKIDASLSPRFESIPCVAIGEILGLLSIVRDEPKTPNIYDIADQIGKEFGETLSIVKAAETLGLVETPRNDVTLTSAGLDFLSSGGPGRKSQLGNQLRRLRIFSHLFALLKMGSRVDASQILSDIALNHPYENARKMLQTIVSWGRYAGLMDYNTFTHQIVVPDNRPPTGAAEPANP